MYNKNNNMKYYSLLVCVIISANVQYVIAKKEMEYNNNINKKPFEIESNNKKKQTEIIKVTGTRINNAKYQFNKFSEIIDSKRLIASGFNTLGDYFNYSHLGNASINSQTNNGGDGTTKFSFRYLGAERMLILVDGTRWSNANNGVDLNTIPIIMIDRIEVLKTGASSIYGSDAIAGAINIITKKRGDNHQAHILVGGTDKGDGVNNDIAISLANENQFGHSVMGLSYEKSHPVWAKDREITRVPIYGTDLAFGSSATPQGRFTFFDPSQNLYNVTVKKNFNGTVGKPRAPRFANDRSGIDYGDFDVFTDADRYNYALQNYLQTPNQRFSTYINNHFFLSENTNIHASLFYQHRNSSQLVAPTPLFLGPFAGGEESINPTVISKDNIYNPFNQDIFGENDINRLLNFGFIGRRITENGNRTFRQKLSHWRVNLGLESEFSYKEKEFTWNVNYIFSDNRGDEYINGRLNYDRVKQALSKECNYNVSCVPLNLFGGEGSITQEQINYITSDEQHRFGSRLQNYTANIVSDLFMLPSGYLQVSMGTELRKESAYLLPDKNMLNGNSSGGQRLATKGDFTEIGYYAEFSVPIIKKQNMIDNLTANFAIRHTRLSHFANLSTHNTSSKVSLFYQANDELSANFVWAQGFRAPSIDNLFGGLTTTYPVVQDPCASQNNLIGCAHVPDSYVQPNSQIEGQISSNELLTPETSTSIHYGIFYQPDWLQGFDLGINVWQIEIDDIIDHAGFQQVLNTCAGVETEINHPVNEYCDDLVKREPSGALSTLINPYLNLGRLKTRGIDVNLHYQFSTNVGDINLLWDSTYTDKFVNYNDGEQGINRVGKNLGSDGYPRIKSNLLLQWRYEDWSINVNNRFISSQRENCDGFENFATLCHGFYLSQNSSGEDVKHYYRDLGHYLVQDLQINYYRDDIDAQFTFGINNVFDKSPPISVTAFSNSFDVNQYDGKGRYIYGKLTFSF